MVFLSVKLYSGASEEGRYHFERKYERILESHTKRNGTPAEYKTVTSLVILNFSKIPISVLFLILVMRILNIDHIGNCFSVFPSMKEAHNGKYVELDFSQNLALPPKDEVQSAHFSGKQFTLHCSIVDPVGSQYYFHLSDDTIHDPVFLDHVLCDIIIKWHKKSKSMDSQSRNKIFSFFSKSLRIQPENTYDAAYGHEKGAIDGKSRCDIKNIFQKISWRMITFSTRARNL